MAIYTTMDGPRVSGIALLDPGAFINGALQQPFARYVAADAGASSWTGRGAGGALAITGAGGAPSLAQATCFQNDTGVKFNGGAGSRHYRSAGTTDGQVTTEDLLFELVFRHETAAKNCRLFQKSEAGLKGWTIYQDAGSNKIYGYFNDGANTVLPTAPAAMALTRYYHLVLFMDRSEASTNGCKIIQNGTAGTGVDPSALLTITNTGHMTIGAAEDGSSPADNMVVYCAAWAKAGWFAGGAGGAAEILTWAQNRYARLKGIGG